jgi:hypothetical protein
MAGVRCVAVSVTDVVHMIAELDGPVAARVAVAVIRVLGGLSGSWPTPARGFALSLCARERKSHVNATLEIGPGHSCQGEWMLTRDQRMLFRGSRRCARVIIEASFESFPARDPPATVSRSSTRA